MTESEEKNAIGVINEGVDKCAAAAASLHAKILRYVYKEAEFNIDTLYCRERIAAKARLQKECYDNIKSDVPEFAEKFKESADFDPVIMKMWQ